MKLLAAVFALAAMLTLAVTPVMQVNAATPDTWTVFYDTDRGDWSYKLNGERKDHWELYYFYLDFKDGDKLVVDDGGSTERITLDVNKKISELAIATNPFSTINATGVDYVYALPGAAGIVNADVTKASVANDVTLQINGNVKELYAKDADGNCVHANVGIMGTVDYAEVAQYGKGLAALPAYNFAAGAFSLNNSEIYLQTSADKYSTTGSAPSQATAAESTSTSQPANTKELDAVPKTGGFDYTPVFFTIGLAFLFGGIAVSRRKQVK